MATSRRLSEPTPLPTELAFDVTQEIDPALAELLRPKRTAPPFGADTDEDADLPPATAL